MLRNEEGITLIELLATIAFIGLILISSTLILTNSIQVGKITDRRNQGIHLAEMVMEDLQTRTFTSTGLRAGTYSYPLDGHTGRFQARYQITDPNPADSTRWADGQPLLKTIQVTVTWLDGDTPRDVVLVTYRARTTLN